MRQEYQGTQTQPHTRSISQPANEYERHVQDRINSLEDLRHNASTPDTRIIHSSENDTNTGVQESTTGPLTLELSSDLRGITDLIDEDDALMQNPQNTQVSGISDDSTLPPNQQVEGANEDSLGLERNEGINQNQNQRRETVVNNKNNELNTNQIRNEQHIATVGNAEIRPTQRPLIPSGSQEATLPIRPQEILNNTGDLKSS